VLEDLQDADRGKLDLLLYQVRTLHDTRLLVVGTYRGDVEVDRLHPLAAAHSESFTALAMCHECSLPRWPPSHVRRPA
jgi:hypothetical protein